MLVNSNVVSSARMKKGFAIRCQIIFAVVGLLAAASAASQSDDSDLPTVIVTASRVPEPAINVPNSLTVIGIEEIRARNPLSAVDLLRQVPGLHISQAGGQGGQSQVFMRGGDPNFTVVLIDGVMVNDPTNSAGGSFDFSTLELESIERVEIVKEPLSAVFGPGSLSGVVNIITKYGGEKFGGSIGAEVGGDQYRRAGLQLGGPIAERSSFGLTASFVDDGTPVQGSAYEHRAVTGKLLIGAGAHSKLGFASRFATTDSMSYPEFSGGPLFAANSALQTRDLENRSASATFAYQSSPAWAFDLLASWYRNDAHIASPAVPPGELDGLPASVSNTRFERAVAVASASFFVGDGLRVTVGIDTQHEDGRNDSFLDFGFGGPIPTGFALDRTISGVFVETRYMSQGGTSVLASLRTNDADDYETEVPFRVGVAHPLSRGNVTLKANYSEGFKLPSFFALANPLVGDPDLHSETSRNLDVGVEAGISSTVTLSVTGFFNRYQDLIDFDPDLFRMVNRSDVETGGVELEFDFVPQANWYLRSQLTYLETEIKESTASLRGRPKWRWGASAGWAPSDRWDLHANYLYVDDVLDSSIPTGEVVLGLYRRVDISARWKLSDHWILSFAVDNLLDADYQEAVGFPAPGIRPRVSAIYEF